MEEETARNTSCKPPWNLCTGIHLCWGSCTPTGKDPESGQIWAQARWLARDNLEDCPIWAIHATPVGCSSLCEFTRVLFHTSFASVNNNSLFGLVDSMLPHLNLWDAWSWRIHPSIGKIIIRLYNQNNLPRESLATATFFSIQGTKFSQTHLIQGCWGSQGRPGLKERKWSCSVMSDSLQPKGYSHQAPQSLGFSGRSTGVGCHFLLHGIFLTQRLKPGLPHCRQKLYHLSHQGSLSRLKPSGKCFQDAGLHF